MRKKVSIWLIIPTTISLILFFTAIIHRLQLNDVNYTKSILGPIQIIAVLLLLLYLINFFVIIYLIFKRRWKDILYNLLCIFLSLLFFILSMWINAPTLLYAT